MFDITLSFDNGPSKATPEVLDLLARYGIRSTFFVVGRRLEHASLREHAARLAGLEEHRGAEFLLVRVIGRQPMQPQRQADRE